MECKNCYTDISLNFCPNCGQKKHKRIDHHYIKDEIQYTVLHMNKGFFYSIKQILKNPGKTARNFIDGNRVNHYKPILLLFVLAGIHTFLLMKVLKLNEINNRLGSSLAIDSDFKIPDQNSLYDYAPISQIIALPFVSLLTWLVFKKWGFNLYENIVRNAILSSYTILLNIIIIFPIQFLLKDQSLIYFSVTSLLQFILTISSYFYFYINFYNDKNIGDVILRLLFLLGLFILIIFVCAILFVVYNLINQNV